MRIASQVLPKQKFPMYMGEDFMNEGLRISLPDTGENEELHSQYAAEQFFDYLDALAFIEKEMLAKGGIQAFTVEDLEKFILSLSKIITHSLILPYGSHGLAGHYAEKRGYMVKETDIPGVSYDPIKFEVFSENNYQVIHKRDGEIAANNYKDFCVKLRRHMDSEAEELKRRKGSLTPKDIFNIDECNLEAATKRANLSAHPGYAVFRKIYVYAVEPQHTKQKIREFCQGIIDKVKAKMDPALIAASAFDFSHLHPLANGNGRESRGLSNGILMSYGLMPVNFDKAKANYYQAIENRNPQTMVQLIKRAQANINPDSMAQELIDGNNIHTYGSTAKRYAAIRGKGYLNLVLNDNMSKYCELLTQKMQVLATADRMPVPREFIDKGLESFDKEINTLVYRRVDSDYCARKATKFEVIEPRIAGYYWVRAAELAVELDEKQRAAELYINAAKIAKNNHFYSFAYDCLQEAVQLNPSLRASEAGQLLNELNFVREYREKTFRELPPANAAERRLWLQDIELRNKYYIVLDKIAVTFEAGRINIAKLDTKYQDKCSPLGWQLYALKGSQFLLAVLNFDKAYPEVEKLFTTSEDLHLVTLKSGNKPSLGICFIPSEKVVAELSAIAHRAEEELLAKNRPKLGI